MATKIGLGELTDVHINNFGLLTGADSARPGNAMYDKALANLVQKGGDDLKGVSDPLERISSAVSRFIEENGMTDNMQAEHARMNEALGEGRKLSPFNQQMHRSRDLGLTMREAASSAPVVAAPSMADLKAAVAGASTGTPNRKVLESEPSPQKMGLVETIRAEKIAKEEAARNALPATRESIEESGYLYHYAPRDARESIVSGGFDVSKARTAVADVAGAGSEFSTHVPENSMYFYTNPADATSGGKIFGIGETGERPDLYRVKVEPGMLDDMAVDPRLAIRDGVGSAVIVPSKTGKFEAELIGENALFGKTTDDLSPATYDPIHPAPAASTADDLVEPSVVKKVENPTREAYDAARAKGELIVTEPVTPKPPPSAPTVPTPTAPPAAPTVPPPPSAPAAPTPTTSVPPPTPAPTGDTVTAAGKARTMVKANYSAMSDDELLSHFEKVKADYAEQLVKDPDGKAFLPTAKSSLEGTERELTKRGIHPGSGVNSTAAAPSPGKRPTIGTKVDDVTTTPKVDGPKVGKPAASTSSIEDLVDLADDQKRNMANLTNAPSGSTTTAAAKISSNVDDVDMTARQAMGFIGDQIKDLRKTKKILSNDGAKGVAEAVTQGIKGSKNLRLAALGTAVGLGGYAASRFQHRNNNSDLRG
jgi:hypothetical protein